MTVKMLEIYFSNNIVKVIEHDSVRTYPVDSMHSEFTLYGEQTTITFANFKLAPDYTLYEYHRPNIEMLIYEKINIYTPKKVEQQRDKVIVYY